MWNFRVIVLHLMSCVVIVMSWLLFLVFCLYYLELFFGIGQF